MYRALCHILQQQHQVHHSSPLPSIRPLQIQIAETAATEGGEERMPESKMATGQKVAQPKSAASKKSEKSAQSKEKPMEQQQQQKHQQTFLCNVRDLAKNGMLEVTVENGNGTSSKLLVLRMAHEFFAMQPTCPNCESPLAQGVLCPAHVRCALHGSAFNLRNGLLFEEDGAVGLNSVWTFKVQLVGQSLYLLNFSAQKLRSVRLGSEPFEPLPSPTSALINRQKPIVIVGGGIAGVTCAQTLRQLSYTGPIVLISREYELPYDRKSLSKKLLPPSDGTSSKSACELRLLLHPREFLEHQLGLTLWLGQTVKAIRSEQKLVMVEEDNQSHNKREATTLAKSVEFAELVLAIGATSRRLQGVKEAENLEGILYMRTLADARHLAKEVVGKNVAIIGSGFLGFELASAIADTAGNVSIFGKATTPTTLLGTEVGNEIRKFMQEQGISVRQESILRSIGGFDRVQQLTFRDGLTTNADTLIVAIGVMPCTSFLMGSGIHTNAEGFVLVDEQMCTNVPNVYACGDCVKFPMPSLYEDDEEKPKKEKKRLNLPHWQIAQFQARQVAYSILGISSAQHRLVPFLWIRLFDRHITFSGDPIVVPDERIRRGTIQGNDFVVYLLKAGRVCAVANCGPKNVAVQFIELFRRQRQITKAEVEKNTSDDWSRHLMEA